MLQYGTIEVEFGCHSSKHAKSTLGKVGVDSKSAPLFLEGSETQERDWNRLPQPQTEDPIVQEGFAGVSCLQLQSF